MSVLRTILGRLVSRAARSYVAGPHLSDAISYAQALAREGLSSTIAYWNPRGEAPADVHAAYLAAIDGAAGAGTDTCVSIKAPALSMSQAFADTVAEHCRRRAVCLHFDSLSLEHQDQTLDMIERLASTGVTLGCTLPGRFARSVSDAERAVRHRLRVRVVKGQWEDPRQTIEPRAGFMAVIDRLAGRAVHVAVATHDHELAEEALAALKARGTSTELELLLGLPVRRPRDVANRLDVPVRVYVPYGYAWLPYALSAARKNPRILGWILEDAVRGGALRAHRRL